MRDKIHDVTKKNGASLTAVMVTLRPSKLLSAPRLTRKGKRHTSTICNKIAVIITTIAINSISHRKSRFQAPGLACEAGRRSNGTQEHKSSMGEAARK